MDNTKQRLKYATKKVSNRSVVTMSRSDWENLVREDGLITEVNSLGPPFENIMEDANVVAAMASGYDCSTPGIDIVRYDQKDDPFVYNIDHYTIVQSYQLHNMYNEVITAAGIADSEDLRNCLSKNVFIIKQNPNEISDHWSKVIPERVKRAIKKSEKNEKWGL